MVAEGVGGLVACWAGPDGIVDLDAQPDLDIYIEKMNIYVNSDWFDTFLPSLGFGP